MNCSIVLCPMDDGDSQLNEVFWCCLLRMLSKLESSWNGISFASGCTCQPLFALQSIFMVHALRRISYATCHPECRQFSFLAREPKADTSFQYCHVFITRNPQEVSQDKMLSSLCLVLILQCKQLRSDEIPLLFSVSAHCIDRLCTGLLMVSDIQLDYLA